MPKRSSFIECVLQALVAHVAGQADPLGLPGRAALLREERLGVGLRAQRALLPTELLGVSVEQIQLSHGLALSTRATLTARDLCVDRDPPWTDRASDVERTTLCDYMPVVPRKSSPDLL